jgi:lipid-A-disaccharide synthase
MRYPMKKVLIVAGEASGDLHGSRLVNALLKIDPDIYSYGIGGEKMEKEGVKIIFNASELAVVGIFEVLTHFKVIIDAFQTLKRLIHEEPPDLLILIDYPDFNLRIARTAKKRGIPILYYISPQVWAWRMKRVKKIAQLVNRMAVVFPFEVPIYEKERVEVDFVGHPLLDVVKAELSQQEALERFGLEPAKVTIGLLPGSRKGELRKILPAMLDAAKVLEEKLKDVQFILPLASGLPEGEVLEMVKEKSIHVKIVRGDIYEVINTCFLVIVASGTATLETAILGKPMVIVYKISFLTYLIGRMMIAVKNIGMVNIVAGKEICPELIQGAANPQRIAQEVMRIVRTPGIYQEMQEELKRIKEKLGQPGASLRVARIAYQMMGH